MNLTCGTLWRLGCLAVAIVIATQIDPAMGSLIFLVGAVTPTTMVELNDLAKDYFTNVYVQLVNPDTPLKQQFSKLENAQFTGKLWIFGVKTQIGGGSANAGANKTLPAAQAGLYDQGQATVVRTYTRMALDGLAIEVTKRQQGSYRPALSEVMSDRLQAHDLEVNRQMFCNGGGPAATANAQVATLLTDSGTSQVLSVDYGVVNGGLGSRHIYVGDVLQPYSQADVARTKCTVTAVDHATATITVTPDPVTTAGDYFARATADTDNHIEGECIGLLASVKDSGTLFTIPATGPWKSVRLHNSGTLRDISDSLVMQAIEQARARSRLTPDLAVCRIGIILKYSEIFLPLRRIDGQDVKLKGGYKPLASIMHAGGSIPVVGDNDCPNSRLFLLNTGAFRLADVVGTDWADMDGATFDRITDKDGIEGYIRKYWQLITVQRNANAVVEDLNDIGAIDKAA